MKKHYLFVVLLIIVVSCRESKEPIMGTYTLEVNGIKNVTTGELEIVGEKNDYFGKITLHSNRERVYAIGLNHSNEDSLAFILPGKGGYLRLKKDSVAWKGTFKYFGLEAEIRASKTGPPSVAMKALVHLKPVGPGVISTDEEESFPSFDNTNRLLYFTRAQKIYASKLTGTYWEEPERLSFSQDFDDSAPYVLDNGESVLFTSNRPLDQTETRKKNLWWVEKSTDAWSDPKPLPYPVNVDSLGDYHGAISANGKVYFISYNRNGGFGRSDIYQAARDSNGDFEVSNLGKQINSEKSEADIYIDPEERYLLFAATGREDSYGADDIYISRKEGDHWGVPYNLGPKVNSFAYEYGSWIDQENKFLYFNSFRRGTSDIYRVGLSELEIFDLE